MIPRAGLDRHNSDQQTSSTIVGTPKTIVSQVAKSPATEKSTTAVRKLAAVIKKHDPSKGLPVVEKKQASAAIVEKAISSISVNLVASIADVLCGDISGTGF